MLQLQGPKNNFWLLTADNAGALTVNEIKHHKLPHLKGLNSGLKPSTKRGRS